MSEVLSSPTTTKTLPITEKDSGESRAYVGMIMLGVALLLPWKCFISGSDYFLALYPGMNIEYWFAAMYNLPLLGGLLLTTLLGRESWSLRVRVNTALCFMSMSVASLFLLDYLVRGGHISVYTGFICTLLAIFCSGASTSVAQASLYGLAGLFGEYFTQALQVGKGYAGIAVIGIRMATKPTWRLSRSTMLYFGLTLIVLLSGFFIFHAMLQFPFVKARLRVLSRAATQASGVSQDDSDEGDSDGEGDDGRDERRRDGDDEGEVEDDEGEAEYEDEEAGAASAPGRGSKTSKGSRSPGSTKAAAQSQVLYQPVSDYGSVNDPLPGSSSSPPRTVQFNGAGGSFQRDGPAVVSGGARMDSFSSVATEDLELISISSWHVMGKTWHVNLAILITFIVCLGLFPGVSTSFVSQHGLGSWFPVLMIAAFDVGDLIGKALPAHFFIFSAKQSWAIYIPLTFHVCFVPLFIIGVRSPDDPFFGSEWYYSVLVLALGISTGFIGCSAMMLAPLLVDDEEKETAGMLETVFLVGGLFGGSVLGVIISMTALPHAV